MKVHPHRWGIVKGISYSVCMTCGLVKLRNPLTQKAIQYGCDHKEHPQYIKYLNKIKGK